MPQLRYLVAADNAIIDSATGKISIIGVFDLVRIREGNSSAITSFAVVGHLYGLENDTDTSVVVQLFKPNGEMLKEVPLPNFQTDNGKRNIMAHFGATEFTEVGEYTIKVLVNGYEVDSKRSYVISAVLTPLNQ